MKQTVINFIQQSILANQQTITSDQDLLISGLIDSMGVMRLVTFLEENTGKRIPPEDVTLENFASVDDIVGYLADA